MQIKLLFRFTFTLRYTLYVLILLHLFGIFSSFITELKLDQKMNAYF